jgi:hypothetical protein
MSEQSKEELLERIKELEAKLADQKPAGLKFKVGEKGGVSVYELGRFPVTLYYEQWTRLLEHADELKAFLEENKGKLRMRPKE